MSWLVATSGGAALATVAFMAGTFWSSRRTKHQLISLSETQVSESANSSAMPETAWDDNQHSHQQESSRFSQGRGCANAPIQNSKFKIQKKDN